ncbi:MAG: hypothetical protein ACAH59_11175 [Pseudobdellovibrionaceae bacterium]
MKILLALFPTLFFLACAEVDDDLLPTEQLRKSTYCYKPSVTLASCSVIFYSGTSSTYVMLEDEAVVAWNGNRSIVSGNAYVKSFSHSGSDPIQMTVVRPEAGATTVDIVEIE